MPEAPKIRCSRSIAASPCSALSLRLRVRSICLRTSEKKIVGWLAAGPRPPFFIKFSFFDRTPCAETGSATVGPVWSNNRGLEAGFCPEKERLDGTGSAQCQLGWVLRGLPARRYPLLGRDFILRPPDRALTASSILLQSNTPTTSTSSSCKKPLTLQLKIKGATNFHRKEKQKGNYQSVSLAICAPYPRNMELCGRQYV